MYVFININHCKNLIKISKFGAYNGSLNSMMHIEIQPINFACVRPIFVNESFLHAFGVVNTFNTFILSTYTMNFNLCTF